jgi:hypothetical protein
MSILLTTVPKFEPVVILLVTAVAFPDFRRFLWHSDVCIGVYGELEAHGQYPRYTHMRRRLQSRTSLWLVKWRMLRCSHPNMVLIDEAMV